MSFLPRNSDKSYPRQSTVYYLHQETSTCLSEFVLCYLSGDESLFHVCNWCCSSTQTISYGHKEKSPRLPKGLTQFKASLLAKRTKGTDHKIKVKMTGMFVSVAFCKKLLSSFSSPESACFSKIELLLKILFAVDYYHGSQRGITSIWKDSLCSVRNSYRLKGQHAHQTGSLTCVTAE